MTNVTTTTLSRPPPESSSLIMTSRAGGWLQGRKVGKGSTLTSASATRSSTPHQQVQSTSTTVFGGGVKDPSGRTTEYFVRLFFLIKFSIIERNWKSMDDQCPVCRSDRYLNPKLRLLVSSCYHKMCVLPVSAHLIPLTRCFPRCESCIDRLFTLGPAPCPVCNKTLRKLAFTPQTFEDLTVEKEVAVRRRLAKEYVAVMLC